MYEIEHSVSILGWKLRAHLWEEVSTRLYIKQCMNYLRASRKWPLDSSCLAYLACNDSALWEWKVGVSAHQRI